jgi:hypothetical protein
MPKSSLEHDIFGWLTLVIVAAIIADLLTHGSVTQSLAKTIATLVNSGFRVAAGQSAGSIG